LLAVNAFVITILAILVLGFLVAKYVGKPLIQLVNVVCTGVDSEAEARETRERLEREEEARLRAEAENELETELGLRPEGNDEKASQH
jgi:hypothetical protein